MSYIIKSEQDIVELSYLLEKLRNKGYNNDLLEEIFNTIVPKNSHFPISVLFGKSKTPVFFSVKDQKIWVSPERLKHFINITINILVKNYPNLEKEIFYNFVLLVVLHEVEHYYQYLISKEYVEFPYKMVIDGYHNLTRINLAIGINTIPSLIRMIRILFYYNGDESLLERNANVESLDLLVKVAKYENNVEMLKILRKILYDYLSIGYITSNNGSMEQTYKKKGLMSIYNSFGHNEVIPAEDRVRYGLQIDDETRKKVLKRKFEI